MVDDAEKEDMSSRIKVLIAKVLRQLVEVLGLSLNTYFEILATIIPGDGGRRLLDQSEFLKQLFGQPKTRDERIEQLHDAREKLEDGLAAIQELEEEAKKNRKDVESTLADLQKLESEKMQLTKQHEEIKKFAEVDLETTRRVFGLPTKPEIFRNRIIGFFAGIIISILAAIIFELVVRPIFIS